MMTDLIIPTGHYVLDEMECNNFNLEEFANLLQLDIQFLIQFLNGEKKLTKELAHKIETILDIPSVVLLNLENRYREQLKNTTNKEMIDQHEYLTKLVNKRNYTSVKTSKNQLNTI